MSETATIERRILSGERLERYNAITARLEGIAQARRASREALRQVPYGDLSALHGQIEALRSEEEALTAELAPLTALKKIDDVLAAQVRPYVEIAREVARVAPAEVTDALKIVLGALIEVGEGLTEEHDRWTKLLARNAQASYKAYVDAGFDHATAAQLVIADRVATSSILGNAGRGHKG